MAIMARVTWGCELDEVSMLHALRYVKAAGGLDRLLDVEGGAQQDRFPAGTQQIAVRMADELGARVLVNNVVRRIHRPADGAITFPPASARLAAKAVVVAIPPAHRAAIVFEPDLPQEYGQLARHWPQGNLSKAYPAYRRQRALACFATLFGDDALRPIDYVDHCWGAEEFAPGGPTAAVPPGSWTTYGPWLRRPVAGIHWAGTETADEWTGFLDGAVRSGKRAADEVHRALTG